MDHKEVIPASYQEYDDKCEEEDGDEEEGVDGDEEEGVDEDEESLTTTSDPAYTPLLPDEGEEVDDVEEMESLEEEATCPLTPLLPYRQRENMYSSEDERQALGCMKPSVEGNEGKEEEAMEEGDSEDSVLSLVIPLVSIVITEPTPEIERRTLEGWLEEQEDEDDEDLISGDHDEEKKEEVEENKENIWPDSKAGNGKSIRVGSKKDSGEEAAAVTPELSQKIFGGEETDSDEREEGGNEMIKATPDTVEKSQVKSGISFDEGVKAEEEEEDDKDGEKGGARMKRRSSLFTSVTKATSILRYCKRPSIASRCITLITPHPSPKSPYNLPGAPWVFSLKVFSDPH